MAESIVKDFKGKMDWVYVGKAEAPKSVEKKADTLFNEYMQRVFDVAAPVGLAEINEAAAVQGLMAIETAKEIIPKSLIEEAQKDWIPGQARDDIKKKWLEWEKKVSTPEHQERLGKLLTGMAYMAGSFTADRLSDVFANELFLKNKSALGGWKPLHLDDIGNKKMVEAGWDFITDTGIEKFTDWSVKKIANREDVGFVSPLSRTISKLGSTVLTVFNKIYDEKTQSVPMINSFVNPGFIEGAFRFAGAIPGGGFIKQIYGWGNQQIMKGEGLVPFGTDLAYNMLIAKWMNKEQKTEAGKIQSYQAKVYVK